MASQLPSPYLLFLGDIQEPRFAKTAFGLRDWAADRCIGEWAIGSGGLTTGLPILRPAEARRMGARAMVIGAAPVGGAITEPWVPSLIEALEAGLDLVSGMHTRLSDVPALAAAAARCGRRLIDVRTPPDSVPVATGRKRRGLRLLTVGTDCALGKKYAALAIARAFAAQGVACDFRATGQTGILIRGEGVAIDSVKADFVAGAAEALSPDAADDHWDVIEGQGAILHPAYAGVSLGLLHGSQPDVIVVCHEVGRTHLLGFPDCPIPSLEEVIDLSLRLAVRTNPGVRCAGVSLNTAALDEAGAAAAVEACGRRLELACGDPIRGGPAFEALVTACLDASSGARPISPT
jgi:uncharacterized NAD-dependent epimerase/dehydratase family protein